MLRYMLHCVGPAGELQMVNGGSQGYTFVGDLAHKSDADPLRTIAMKPARTVLRWAAICVAILAMIAGATSIGYRYGYRRGVERSRAAASGPGRRETDAGQPQLFGRKASRGSTSRTPRMPRDSPGKSNA